VEAHAPTTNELADERTRDALIRTQLAYERTLMAWVRTATALISFGFTIYKFFQFLVESGQMPPRPRLLDARGVALVLIGLGVAALALAVIEHRHALAQLRPRYERYRAMPRSLATPVAFVLAGLGVAGLVLVALRQ
jgi:putative membrane protein